MLNFNIKKIAKIFGFVVLAVVILLFLLLIWTRRKIDNGEWLKWEGKWISRGEFEKIIPPQVYKVESKNKPEEVYTAFRQALLDNDTEKALSLMVAEKREVYREAFADEGKLSEWVKKLPEGFVKEDEDGNYSYYDWNKNDGYKHTVIFIKNRNGYWEIDQI
jgi:hypothetical protein